MSRRNSLSTKDLKLVRNRRLEDSFKGRENGFAVRERQRVINIRIVWMIGHLHQNRCSTAAILSKSKSQWIFLGSWCILREFASARTVPYHREVDHLQGAGKVSMTGLNHFGKTHLCKPEALIDQADHVRTRFNTVWW